MPDSADENPEHIRAQFLKTPNRADARQRRRSEQRARGLLIRDARLRKLRSQRFGAASGSQCSNHEHFKTQLAEVEKLWTNPPGSKERLAGWQRLSDLLQNTDCSPDISEENGLDTIMSIKPIPILVSDLMPGQDSSRTRQTCTLACEIVTELIWMGSACNSQHMPKFMNLVPLLITHLSGYAGYFAAESCAYALGCLAGMNSEQRHKICLNGAVLPLTHTFCIGLSETIGGGAIALTKAAGFALSKLSLDTSSEIKGALSTKDFKQILQKYLRQFLRRGKEMSAITEVLQLINSLVSRSDSILRLSDLDPEISEVGLRLCQNVWHTETSDYLSCLRIRLLIQILGNSANKEHSGSSLTLSSEGALLWWALLKTFAERVPRLIMEFFWALRSALLSSPSLRAGLRNVPTTSDSSIVGYLNELKQGLQDDPSESNLGQIVEACLKLLNCDVPQDTLMEDENNLL